MIPEKIIDQVLEDDHIMENSTFYDNSGVAPYLMSEAFDVLSQVEQKSLVFVCDVIYNAHILSYHQEPHYDMDQMTLAEEKNWQIRESNKNWDTTKDLFFDNYKEEDLLAFVEDYLSDNEDAKLTEIGSEMIFITAKSYIDSISGGA